MPSKTPTKLKPLLRKHGLLTDATANDGYFDTLVIDEASQFPLTQLPPLAHLLRRTPEAGIGGATSNDRTGRLVVVGDPRQMGTILQNEYPQDASLTEGSPPAHWSLLSYLRAAVERCDALRVNRDRMLLDNHRMTDSLANFTRLILQYNEYTACHLNNCPCHRATNGVPRLTMSNHPGIAAAASPERQLVQEALLPQNTFVMIEVKGSASSEAGYLGGSGIASSYDPRGALTLEADLVVELILSYLRWRSDGDDPSVFVVAPHHIQRHEIQKRLDGLVRIRTMLSSSRVRRPSM